MKKTILLTIIGLILSDFSFGQNSEKDYSELISEAWNLYEVKEYLKSGQKYTEAFAIGKGGTLDDRYNAACS